MKQYYNTMQPSDEQKIIIEAIYAKNNVIVNAVAGSGKTTTIMLCAKNQPALRILHLTYNKHLQIDAKEKKEELGLKNIEILTIHGFCRKYYNDDMGDEALLQALNTANPLYVKHYDVIFVDECQDLNLLYFRFIRKIMRDFDIDQIVLLGDVWQTVYRFKDSDERYMLMADKLFDRPFLRLNLNQSFRLTAPIAEFVNAISGCKIRTQKPGEAIYYGSPKTSQILELIFELLQRYAPEDIFILTSSTRQDYNLKLLENKLVERKVPVFVPDDEQRIRDEVANGKLTITTFHQAKGRERKVVLMAPFGERYYTQTKADPNYLTEALYVGITRAKEVLYLFTDWGGGGHPVNYLPNFANLPCIYIEEHLVKNFKPTSINVTPYSIIKPSEFVRHLPKNIVEKIIGLKEIIFTKQSVDNDYEIIIDNTVESTIGGSSEQIADINGIAIPFLHLLRFPEYAKQFDNQFISHIEPILSTLGGKFPPRTPSDCLKIALCIWSQTSGYQYKLQQIRHFDWLNMESVNIIIDRFMQYYDEDLQYEIPRELTIKNLCTRNLRYRGVLDAANSRCIFEYKFCDTLSVEHFLQVMLYAYAEILWCKMKKIKTVREIQLINFKTNEIYKIFDLNDKANVEFLTEQIREIILAKIEPKRLEDDAFIAAAKVEDTWLYVEN